MAMSPLQNVLVAIGAAALGLAPAAAQDVDPPARPPSEQAPDSSATGTPAGAPLQSLQQQGAGSVAITPRGRPRRRAPRFAPFAADGAQSRSGEIHPFPESISDPNRSACNQQLTAQQRAENRREAEQVVEMLNRMAELANDMSVRQARQNGVAVAPGAMVRIDPNVTDAVERMLNCDEQRQAADATERALAGPVGTAVSWTSESRPGVSGSSTVTAVDAAAPDGSQCLTVTDVVIIDGAETRAPKRMCRIPPSTRYVRV